MAFHLARMGTKSIALLDKGTWASGMTGKSSATVTLAYGNPVLAKLALASLRFFQRFEEETGGDAGYVQSGHIVIVDAEEEHTLERNLELQRSVGTKAHVIRASEMGDIEPEIEGDASDAFAYYPESGYASPNETARSFAEGAARLGATLFPHTLVTGVEDARGATKTLKTTLGDFKVEKVVDASSVGQGYLFMVWGIPTPHDNQAADRNLPQTQRIPWDETLRKRQDQDDVTLDLDGDYLMDVGNIGHGFGSGYDPDDYDERDFERFQAGYIKDLVDRFPIMSGATLGGGYSALYDVTPDHFPILGRVEGSDGYYCAAGMSGQGFKFAPVFGRGLAELILDGKARDFDISIFDLDRFERGSRSPAPIRIRPARCRTPDLLRFRSSSKCSACRCSRAC